MSKKILLKSAKKLSVLFLLGLLLLTPTLTLAEEEAGEENTQQELDTDQDSIPDSTDNCPTVNNPNQIDQDNNNIGDSCDIEYQRRFWEELRQQVTEALARRQENATKSAITNIAQITEGCVSDPSQVDLNPATRALCSEQPTDSDLARLRAAYDNNMIVSVLEEPISNENLYRRAQICTSKYLRDVNGLLQYTDPSESANFNFDNEAGLQETRQEELDKINADTDATVAIALDQCRTNYVQACTPNSTYIREVKLSDPLPVIVTCSTVQLLFANSGVDLLKQYINLIYRWAAGIIGVLAVLVIMINGILISVAGGDDGKVTEAKNRIVQSLSALAILFLAGIILYTINPNYFTTTDLQYDIEAAESDSSADSESETAPTETNEEEE